MTERIGAAQRARIVVIGGANTDIVGVPTAALVPRDSNPGHIRLSPGGVGRNIAENLVRYGVRVSLVTAFGGDVAGRALRDDCEALGIDTSLAIVSKDVPGAHYLAILDEARDMSVAVNDMRVLDLVTPEALAAPARAAAITCADLVVVDTNVPAESIAWIASHATAPVVLEPVSVAKAGRAVAVLSRLAAVTPNAIEAAEMLGHPVEGLDGAEAAAREFVGLGVGSAFVTCGVAGAAWADVAGSGVVAAPDVKVASASGAGDAFCAGVSWALLAHGSAREAAAAGTAFAAMALTDEGAVSRRVAPRAARAARAE